MTNNFFYILAGLLFLCEAFSPGLFVFVSFALASVIAGLFFACVNSNLFFALLINLLFGILFLYTVRPLLKMFLKIPFEKNFKKNHLIGQEAMVFQTISKKQLGLVKVLDFDETWLAESINGEEIGQGSTVTIKSIKDNRLLVRLS